MKAVNKAAAATLARLAELAEERGRREPYAAIENDGPYMPLHVERLAIHLVDNKGNLRLRELWAVSHTYTQNGDLMRDPEIEFLRVRFADNSRDEWYPISFRQDGIGLVPYHPAAELGAGLVVDRVFIPNLQADLASFANAWMKNLRSQYHDELTVAA